MDIIDAAQLIKDSVKMDTILGLYGYETKRGFMPCPLHGEKEASFKVYPKSNSWYCFGCKQGGSPIDFVMAHDGCNFIAAVRGIDNALGLGLFGEGNPFIDEVRRRKQRKYDLFRGDLIEAININRDIIDSHMEDVTRKIREVESKPIPERTADEWTQLLAANEDAQYLEYLKRRFEELGEEVETWRARKRLEKFPAVKST